PGASRAHHDGVRRLRSENQARAASLGTNVYLHAMRSRAPLGQEFRVRDAGPGGLVPGRCRGRKTIRAAGPEGCLSLESPHTPQAAPQGASGLAAGRESPRLQTGEPSSRVASRTWCPPPACRARARRTKMTSQPYLTELFSLEGRVALVTGGSSGIGRAIA